MDLGPLSDDIDLTTGRSHSRPGLGPCGHSGTAEPVRLLDDGQIVAWLCGRCDTQLPADWKPAGELWRRDPQGWTFELSPGRWDTGAGITWRNLQQHYGPVKVADGH